MMKPMKKRGLGSAGYSQLPISVRGGLLSIDSIIDATVILKTSGTAYAKVYQERFMGLQPSIHIKVSLSAAGRGPRVVKGAAGRSS